MRFYLSREKAKSYFKNLPKAIRGRMARKNETAGQQTALVRDFFRAHRDAPDDVDLADHSTGHLDKITTYLLERDAHEYQTIVDVGCGNGAMQFKARPKRYVGVDLHISTEDGTDTFFVQSPISEAKVSHLKVGLTSFYVINCLCYCERLDDLGDFVSEK